MGLDHMPIQLFIVFSLTADGEAHLEVAADPGSVQMLQLADRGDGGLDRVHQVAVDSMADDFGG